MGEYILFIGKLYAIGGHDGDEHLNTGEVFDPVTNRWKSIAPMKTLRAVTKLHHVHVLCNRNNCLVRRLCYVV